MLDKNDLKAIADVVDERITTAVSAVDKRITQLSSSVDKKITDAIGLFFVDTLAPYLDGKFKNIEERLGTQENDLDTLLRKSDKNDDDHDKIFQKLDEIDNHLVGHEKRIKKVETALNS